MLGYLQVDKHTFCSRIISDGTWDVERGRKEKEEERKRERERGVNLTFRKFWK